MELSVAAVAAATSAEVLALVGDEGDQQIFELCVATERSRLLYRILASLLQGILLGLLLAAFFMEMEMAHLNTQSTLSPLRGLTLAVAEGCLAMNILRACEGYQHGLGGREDEDGVRRRAWASVANAAVLGVMNMAVMLCCLLSEMLIDQSTLLQVAGGFGLLAIWPALLDLRQTTSQLMPSNVLLTLLKPLPSERRVAQSGEWH